jgi:ABC-2 type transport system ATP-binding protein
MPMPEPFLRIQSVSKKYENHLAVDAVSLTVPTGEIYGLLGPNGAGKTSIIRMITGITAPDSGSIIFNGEPLSSKHSRFTGYMPEERGLYKKMKVREQIVYLLTLKGMAGSKARAAADSWLEKLELTDWANKNTSDLSKGMQQKVQFISTVAHEPQLLILDEPFSGLDPVNTQVIESEIHRMKAQGITIIFSTHRMEQVEELCDNIALINRGKVMLENNIQVVRRQFQKNIYHLGFEGDPAALASVPGIDWISLTEGTGKLQLSAGQTQKQLLQQLIDSPVEIIRFEHHLPRLNEIFIELVSQAKKERGTAPLPVDMSTPQ